MSPFVLVFGVLAILANRDAVASGLGPRIAHAVLPIPGKRDSDWGYSWIPVAGPVIGGSLGALLFHAVLGG